ncbi:hypothetical protein BH24CHL6_BH24CHL6_08630 [soil metagenome]
MDTRETQLRDPNVEWSDQGYELYDASGDKVGDIIEVNPDYLMVEFEGGLLEMLGLNEPRRMYVPRDAIAREDGERWFLNIEKDRLEEQQSWANRPEGSRYDESYARDEYSDEHRSTSEGERGRTRLVRHEEELDVDKVSRQRGEVTVDKHVVEETKTVEVPVRREEIHVDRHPVDGSADATRSASGDLQSGEAFTEDSITVPLMEEDVEVRKVARPVEEIEISKTHSEDTRRVDETVRREEFDVDDDTSRTGFSNER